MATLLPLSTQTLFSELSQRSLDAAFEGQFPENGSIHADQDAERQEIRLLSGV